MAVNADARLAAGQGGDTRRRDQGWAAHHGYGVHAIGNSVPLNMLCKWMGHASMEVTAIYANALGAEGQGIGVRMWG